MLKAAPTIHSTLGNYHRLFTYECMPCSIQTREDWIRQLKIWLGPAEALLEPDSASIDIGRSGASYGLSGRRLESFARVLGGAVFHYTATGSMPHSESWRQGLSNGTNPRHPAFWGWPGNRDQRLVEMAGIALAIAFATDVLWDPLPQSAKENIVGWFKSGNKVGTGTNNWVLFRLVTNAVLCRLGYPPDPDPFAEDWATMERLYVGDGWYCDGLNARQFDYYIPKGFHLFAIYLLKLHPNLPANIADTIRERALAFLPAMNALQSPEGLLLPYGRSLTYRFAPAAYWGAMAWAGFGETGDLRSRMDKCLSWWSKQPIADSGGLLTIGFRYPNLNIAESYNAPASPYYAFHAFLPLALPNTHPFWAESSDKSPRNEQNEPSCPVEISAFPASGIAVIDDKNRGHHWALNAGQYPNWPMRHHAERYGKFAYSSRHGFQVSGGNEGLNRLGFDSSMAISDDGLHWRLWRPSENPTLCDEQITTEWDDPDWIHVIARIEIIDGRQKRQFSIEAKRPLWIIEGGWPFPINAPNKIEDQREEICAGGIASASRPETSWHSSIEDQSPGIQREAFIAVSDPNLNILHPNTLIPGLREFLQPGSYDRQSIVSGYGYSDT